MKFSFMLSVDAQAGDQLDDLRDQLEALGHEFAVNRGVFMPPPWFNLFSEGISEVTNHQKMIAALHATGYQLVVLVSEQPTLVNSEGLVWNYRTSEDWHMRAEAFVDLAPHFTAAWCYAPDTAKSIRRFIPHAADIDMAWGKRFAAPVSSVTPTHDFCFFGGLTRRRERVVKEFIRRGHSVDVIPHNSPLIHRDQRIPDSRVVLDIKQYAWWDLVSSVRYVTALCHGRPVVAEARSVAAQSDWANIVRFAPEAAFYEVAAATLANWRDLHQKQVAALRIKPSLMAAAVAALPPISTAEDLPSVEAGRGPITLHTDVPTLIEEVKGINLVGWKGAVYAIPQRLGAVHLDKIELVRFPTIRRFPTIVAARRAVT